MHSFTRALLPDRGKIRRAVELDVADVRGIHREVELDRLVGIEGVDPPGAPVLLPVDEVELLGYPLQALLDPREDEIAVEQAVDEIQIAADLRAVDRRDEVVGIEMRVVGDLQEKGDQIEEPQIVGGRPVEVAGRVGHVDPVGADVAHRAIEPDPLHPHDDPARRPDRQVGLRFVEQADAAVPARPELVAVHHRQRLEHQGGQAARRLAADRAVFEVVDIVAIGDDVLVDEDQPVEGRQDQHENDQPANPPLAGEDAFDGCRRIVVHDERLLSGRRATGTAVADRPP